MYNFSSEEVFDLDLALVKPKYIPYKHEELLKPALG